VFKKYLALFLTSAGIAVSIVLLFGGYDNTPNLTPNQGQLLAPPIITSSSRYDAQLHNNVIYPTVRVNSPDTRTSGSGVIVRSEPCDGGYRNVVLTCAHVVNSPDLDYFVDCGNYLQSRFLGWKSFPAVVYDQDDSRDVAVLLFVSEYPVRSAEVQFGFESYIGNSISHVGCGLGEQPRLERGFISGLDSKSMEHLSRVTRTSMHSIPGDSGGPVFYEQQLIGLLQSIKVTNVSGNQTWLPNISMVIPIDEVEKWDERRNHDLGFIHKRESRLPSTPFIQAEYAPVDWFVESLKGN
jgi:S1-C subfamily serine protease